MTLSQYAILCTANRMAASEKGFSVAQDWRRDVIERVALEEDTAQDARGIRATRTKRTHE